MTDVKFNKAHCTPKTMDTRDHTAAQPGLRFFEREGLVDPRDGTARPPNSAFDLVNAAMRAGLHS